VVAGWIGRRLGRFIPTVRLLNGVAWSAARHRTQLAVVFYYLTFKWRSLFRRSSSHSACVVVFLLLMETQAACHRWFDGGTLASTSDGVRLRAGQVGGGGSVGSASSASYQCNCFTKPKEFLNYLLLTYTM